MATPRGIRNKNPGNVRHNPNNQWLGLIGQDDLGFCIFDIPEHGIRAMAKTLMSYQDKHGLRTIRKIISRWAPFNENNTLAYVRAVAMKLGRGEDEPITLHSHATLLKMVHAIIQHENGGKQPWYPEAVVLNGVNLAMGIPSNPPIFIPTKPTELK